MICAGMASFPNCDSNRLTLLLPALPFPAVRSSRVLPSGPPSSRPALAPGPLPSTGGPVHRSTERPLGDLPGGLLSSYFLLLRLLPGLLLLCRNCEVQPVHRALQVVRGKVGVSKGDLCRLVTEDLSNR